MPRIKLLYVITKLELGGAQKQLLSLIRNIDRKNYQVYLFTAQDGMLLTEAQAINELTIKRSRFLEREINPLKDLLALFELFRFIKKNQIRIVHTHSSKAGILGRLAAGFAGTGIIVHTVHGWPFHDYQPVLWRSVFVWLEKMAGKFTDKLIVVSQADLQKGLKYISGQQAMYTLIHYGVDFSGLESPASQIRKEFGLSADDLLVGNISCFKPQKAPQDFLRLAAAVIKEFPKAKFVLIGDGVLRDDLERSISSLNLQGSVILTGWRRDISGILSAIDVFVLNSLWEGMPISVLEAMSYTKPVVATDTGGIKEVVLEGQSGFLVEPANVEKMSEKLLVLLRDGDLRKKMGFRAREVLGANFRLEKMVEANQQLYSSLLN